MKLPSNPLGTFPFPGSYDVVRTVSLNQTKLEGGNNKYYLIEAHVSKDASNPKYRLYSRYGRVGHVGKEEERIPDQNRSALDQAFNQLLKEKTAPGKYVEVKVAQSSMGSAVAKTMVLSDDVKTAKLTVTSTVTGPAVTLHPSVAKLVERLFTEAGHAVRSQLSGSLKTTTENPLGTLTLTQIAEGTRILGEVQTLLGKKPALINSIKTEVLDLSNQFYSAIPQTMALRPKTKEGKPAMEAWLRGMALNNAKILDDKQELLELLSDVQGVVGGFASNDVVAKHAEIGCEYTFLDPADPERKRIEQFVSSTHSNHHHWRTRILNVWKIGVRGQAQKHTPVMTAIGNIQELFHGSRPANIMGICKHGLLMRPPGAVITGSMFGNGVYYASDSSKSTQYSTARFGGGGGDGSSYFMYVARVSLGRIKEFTSSQPSLTKPPVGYDSVRGKKSPGGLLHDEFISYQVETHELTHLMEFKI